MFDPPSPLTYTQRYELTRSSKDPQRDKEKEGSEPQVNTLSNVIARLTEKVDSMDVKLTSLTNVVRLLQKYTQTKDDQYEKEKENELFRKTIGERVTSIEELQMEQKVREFEALAKQMKIELKSVEKIRMKLSLAQEDAVNKKGGIDNGDWKDIVAQMEDKLRQELNMKVEICMKYMNGLSRQIHDDTETINDLKFTVNRVENDCLRNKMVLEKDVDHFRGVVNGLSRKVARDKDLHKEKLSPHISDRSYRQESRTNGERSKSHQSKSEKSLPKPKAKAVQLSSSSITRKVKDEELREAIRKKKETKQKLNSRNW